MDKHALYATTEEGPTFRIGQPTDLVTAHDRFYRLDEPVYRRRVKGARVRHMRRWYNVRFFEVRSTDRHGHGLGSDRHGRAIPVPYAKCKLVR